VRDWQIGEIVVQRKARQSVRQFAGDRHIARHHDAPLTPPACRESVRPSPQWRFRRRSSGSGCRRVQIDPQILDDGRHGGTAYLLAGVRIDQQEDLVDFESAASACVRPVIRSATMLRKLTRPRKSVLITASPMEFKVT